MREMQLQFTDQNSKSSATRQQEQSPDNKLQHTHPLQNRYTSQKSLNAGQKSECDNTEEDPSA